MVSLSNVLGNFSNTYVNATPRLSSTLYPNGQKTLFDYYDNLGDQRLKQIRNLSPTTSTLSSFSYEYDIMGQITKWTQQADSGTPQIFEFQYDPVDQLLNATLKDSVTSAIVKRYVYGYDKSGNRLTEQIDNAVTKGTFNNVNQMTAQTSTGGNVNILGNVSEPATVTVNGASTALSFDPNGKTNNFFQTSMTNLSIGTNSLTIIAKDYSNNTKTNTFSVNIASGSAKTITMDANGNLASFSIPNSQFSITNGWDAANRCVAIQSTSSNRVEMVYNGVGNRTRITEKVNGVTTSDKYFVFDGFTIVEERDASGNVIKRFFTWGFQIVSGPNAGLYYYCRDHLGSIREIVNSAGVVVARYEFDPAGRMTLVSGTDLADFGFQGMFVLRIPGMTYPVNLTWARIYEPDTARWWSRDWIGKNDYIGLGNSPINNIDPLGLWEDDVHQGGPKQTYGTYTWAKQLGFSDEAALAIGQANANTDRVLNTSPYALPGKPNISGRSRHFDIPLGGVDSRLEWAEKEFQNAIDAWKKGDKCGAHNALGRGLHSIQDRPAHSNWDNEHNPYTYHGAAMDNWNGRGEAVQKEVEKATKDYLKRFLDATK